MSEPTRGHHAWHRQAGLATNTCHPEGSETATLNKVERVPLSPLMPEEDSLHESKYAEPGEFPGPLSSAPDREAYERFSEDFDQEDDVDDYALLHPNLPKATVGENVETNDIAAMLVSPAHTPTAGASTDPPCHIQWVSPIVVHSPLSTPPEVPPMKRRCKKGASLKTRSTNSHLRR